MADTDNERLIRAFDALAAAAGKSAQNIVGMPAKTVLAVETVTAHATMAAEAASRGDWDGAARHLLDMSNSALVVASGGSFLLGQCVYDALAAYWSRGGYPVPTFKEWEEATAKAAGGFLGDIAWGTFHQDQFHSPPPGEYRGPEPADAGAPAGAPDPGTAPADVDDGRPIDIELDQPGRLDQPTGESGGPTAAPTDVFDPSRPADVDDGRPIDIELGQAGWPDQPAGEGGGLPAPLDAFDPGREAAGPPDPGLDGGAIGPPADAAHVFDPHPSGPDPGAHADFDPAGR